MSRIDVLFKKFRDQLLHAEDLEDAASAMFDLLEERTFLDKCGPKNSPILMAYLPVASETLFGKVLPITANIIIYSEAYDFYHGGCLLGNCLVTMGYLEKQGQGLMLVYDPLSDDTQMLRVTNVAAFPEDSPVFLANPAETASD